jgi:pyridinium-3,5-biscarboxylic acid mononucleotide synthase
MNPTDLQELLAAIRDGHVSVSEGMRRLRTLPFEDVGVAMIDHHRELRQGSAEIIFGENKSAEQLATIVTRMVEKGSNILVTRLSQEIAESLLAAFPAGEYQLQSRTFTFLQRPAEPLGNGKLLIVCAGTSDLPVAREAAVTARMLGCQVEELIDVGVAGIHRLLAHSQTLYDASVIIVVAGMEGALPSVIGGMVAVPVIAVPTSVGYGAAFNGLTALL